VKRFDVDSPALYDGPMGDSSTDSRSIQTGTYGTERTLRPTDLGLMTDPSLMDNSFTKTLPTLQTGIYANNPAPLSFLEDADPTEFSDEGQMIIAGQSNTQTRFL
jgi:hypothetical protein